MFRRHYLTLTLACLLGGMAFGQPVPRPAPDTSLIPDWRMDQHRAWDKLDESFPARERRMWQVGINAGMLRATSDVRSEMGLGYGLTIRKGLGSTLSLRAQCMMGTAYGLDWIGSSAVANNPALNGQYDAIVDYYDESNQSGLVYHNYMAEIQELSLEALVSLQNVLFHKRTPWFSPYAALGLGATFYQTSIDQINSNTGGVYDYGTIPTATSFDARDGALEALKGLLDGEYESAGEISTSTYLHGTDRTVKPNASIGGGVAFAIRGKQGQPRRWEITLEHRVVFLNDDLLDGQRWQEPSSAGQASTLSQNNDKYHYTAFGINFNFLKNHQEPDWQTNPLTYAYDQITWLAKQIDTRDDDDDGVPNSWDREPDSEAGAVVDTKGVTKDSDGDGCPDHKDDEPFSSPQYPIKDCKNVLPDGLQSILAGTTKLSEPQVIDRLTELILHGGGGGGMGEWFLPTIHFDLDRSVIRAEDLDELKQIADLMKKNANLKVNVYAHTDSRASDKYNMDLSTKRAQAAVDYINKKYGISPSRFNSHYMGEGDPIAAGAKTEAEHQANRRVEFSVASMDNP